MEFNLNCNSAKFKLDCSNLELYSCWIQTSQLFEFKFKFDNW